MSERLPHAGLDLLERVAEVAPPMSVDPDAVLAIGRRKVRRRRVSSATGVGALVLVGALWMGSPLNPFAPTRPPGASAPAAIDWEQESRVDLFDTAPNTEFEPERRRWTGQLLGGDGTGDPELLLTRDGEQLDPIAAQDGPGDVLVYAVEGLSVAVWQSPAGSLGESPSWAPGVLASGTGQIQVDGAQLNVSTAEIVPGGSGDLEDLYWFAEDAAHAASGAPLNSAELVAGGERVLVMVDEDRGVWGAMQLRDQPGLIHIARLVGDSGLTGWMGQDVGSAAIGVLPQGASSAIAESSTVLTDEALLGDRTVVLAANPTLSSSPPAITLELDGELSTLESLVQYDAWTLVVGTDEMLVSPQPEVLELRLGREVSTVPMDDLVEGRALAAPVADGHLVIVPGWESDATVEDLRVLVGTEDRTRWVEVASAHLGTLFNGQPVALLGLGPDVVAAGETVRGVGIASAEGEVTPRPRTEIAPLELTADGLRR